MIKYSEVPVPQSALWRKCANVLPVHGLIEENMNKNAHSERDKAVTVVLKSILWNNRA